MRESRSLGSVGAKAEWLSYPTATWSAALCQTSCDEKFDPREWSACTRKCGQDFEECFRNNNAGLANCLSGCDKKPKK